MLHLHAAGSKHRQEERRRAVSQTGAMVPGTKAQAKRQRHRQGHKLVFVKLMRTCLLSPTLTHSLTHHVGVMCLHEGLALRLQRAPDAVAQAATHLKRVREAETASMQGRHEGGHAGG